MNNPIFQGIHTALAGNVNITNALGGTAIYRLIAPEQQSIPYIITWNAGGGEDNETPKDSVDLLLGVKIVTKSQTQAGTIMSEIRDSLHRKDLTFGGNWKTLKVNEERPFMDVINAEGSNFIHAGATYRVRAVEEA